MAVCHVFKKNNCDTFHCIGDLIYCPADGDSTQRIQGFKRFTISSFFFFFKLYEMVLKNPESIMYSNNAGFAGSLSFCNNLPRRIKRNEIETMQVVMENRKLNVRPLSDWNCHQRNR